MRTARLAVLLLLLFPTAALANAGAPLLLVVNGLVFLYGMVLIVLAEWGLYVRLAKLPAREAFWDALTANLVSTVVIGFGFPLLIAALGMWGESLPKPAGQILLAAGTWVFDRIRYPRLTFLFTAFWLCVTYVLTVYCEAWFLSRRWRARGVTPPISPLALNWRSNTITYLGLLAVLASSIKGFF